MSRPLQTFSVRCIDEASQPKPPAPQPKRISRGESPIARPTPLAVTPGSPLTFLCPADDVVLQFARSSGAGGQNVNKVNTKVDMRIHLDSAAWLHGDIREAVKRMVRWAACRGRTPAGGGRVQPRPIQSS